MFRVRSSSCADHLRLDSSIGHGVVVHAQGIAPVQSHPADDNDRKPPFAGIKPRFSGSSDVKSVARSEERRADISRKKYGSTILS